MSGDGDDPSVTAVLTVKDPNPSYLAWTMDRLAEQNKPPDEVIVVDASEPPVEVDHSELNTRVVREPGLGIGDARQLGVENANTDYVMEMDADAILIRDDYTERAIEELSRPEVSGAGGVLLPMTEKPTAKMVASLDRLNPSDLGTHYLMYPRANCITDGGDQCYPVPNRGEDRTVRQTLRQFGEISRMRDQPVMKDVPTTRQQKGLKTIGASVAAGVFTSIATSAIKSAFGRVKDQTVASLNEE